MTYALELVDLTKRFGDKTAVEGLSLALEPGTFLGLLGRNGAGKSTTLKMVTGLLKPTSGRIRVLGMDLEADPLAVKRQIGAMPEDMALLDMLTGPQYLRFVGRMYGLEDALIDRRRAELFDTLDLAPGPNTLIADYSFGMKKKAALCAALLHGPRILFLDEPFEGIDPVTSRTIKDILNNLQQRGVTLVLTSHILEVVERLCPLIAILDEGRLKGFGSLDDLRQGGESLEQLFVDLVGGPQKEALSWL
ncbi:MAG: ABC transporter ATP-binding protein [Geothrix sp.]|nr:ABC transporter ATP-binding protein [Geothrix sp.]